MADLPSADRTFPQPLPPVPIPDRARLSASLPTALTSFVGREHEVEQLLALLRRDDVRLLTLTGPGGVGKTRLALRIAEELARHFADCVAFVSLDAVRDPELVAPTIAHALGIREAGDRSVAQHLAGALREQHLLLVLDNFEQVVEAAPLITELLRAAPKLTVLVTSRVRLRVTGEHERAVPPLALTEANDAAVATVAGSAAVRLFVARAQAVREDFHLTAENAPVVAEICRRLDGLPLAIELAAARTKLQPPTSLLSRLNHRLTLLTGGPRDLPARQQTLRDTIIWSHDLLTPGERVMFRRLSVFIGGFDLEAAAAVAVRDDLGLDAFEGIASLVDQSLMRRLGVAEQEPRFGMLETVRDFGLEQLGAGGEEEATRDAHAAHFLARVREVRPRLDGSDRLMALAWAEREHHNLRAALDWAVACGDAETAQRLAGTLAHFWFPLGVIAEGRDWLSRVTTMTGCSATATRVDVLYWAAAFGMLQNDHAIVDSLATQALTLSRQHGYRPGVAMSLMMLGETARCGGDFARATALQQEALALFRELGEPIWGEGVALFCLSGTARQQGDLDRAVRWCEEALVFWQRLDHLWGVPLALTVLANLASRRGELPTAMALYQESLARWRDQGERFFAAECLAGMARVALEAGQTETAVRLFAVTSHLEGAMGFVPTADQRAEAERNLSNAREALGAEMFTAAWSAGRALSLDEAVVEALAVELSFEHPRAISWEDASANVGLTTREMEVLRLIVEGLTNQEIAARLFISRRTVTTHATNILNKLGLDSRAALVAFAVRNGLA